MRYALVGLEQPRAGLELAGCLGVLDMPWDRSIDRSRRILALELANRRKPASAESRGSFDERRRAEEIQDVRPWF